MHIEEIWEFHGVIKDRTIDDKGQVVSISYD